MEEGWEKCSGGYYNNALHQYRNEQGARVTGITEALRAVGLFTPLPESGRARRNFAYAGDRGTAVHSMCAIDDRGESDHWDFDPNLAGYLTAWRAVKARYDFKPVIVERPVVHQVYQFGGTADVSGNMAVSGGGHRYAIAERKTCDLKDEFGFQLALQELLIREEAKVARCATWAFKLCGDGTFLEREYVASFYRPLALSAVAIANWRIKEGTL